MKLTEYEKEVIYRALDNYIALLGSKGDSKTAYEIKTAKEIRSAINLESKQTTFINNPPGSTTFSDYEGTVIPWPEWTEDWQKFMVLDIVTGNVYACEYEPPMRMNNHIAFVGMHERIENLNIGMTNLDWRKCIRKRGEG